MGLLSFSSEKAHAKALISELRSALRERGLMAVGCDFFGDYPLPVRFIEPSYIGGSLGVLVALHLSR